MRNLVLPYHPLCQDSSINEDSSSDWVDDEGFEFFENEQLFLDRLFEDGNDDQDEEALDEIAPTSFLSQEELGELIWDEFDELAHRWKTDSMGS
ncbi:MAG: hypothetical protein HFP81_01820 [Methylococcales symbiont of Hymedesmia sp. n. MRB-2018]|nr:MAG: hypothetical protein HFP81_01820 [Methylococcales symbiont of Hymedesmia sp. n. MRB-2018]